MKDCELIAALRGALNTEETGEALVEVARNAHDAELKIARIINLADEVDVTLERFVFEVGRIVS